MQTIMQRKELSQHSRRNYVRATGIFHRSFLKLSALLLRWEISGCENALYKMRCEEQQLKDEIAGEMNVHAEACDKLRQIEQRL